MTKLLSLLTVFGFLLVSFSVRAGDRELPAGKRKQAQLIETRQQAFQTAKKYIGRLVMIGRLDDSWLQARPGNAAKTSYKGRPEWQVSFFNPAVKEKAKRTVYIFLDNYGHYTGSNYTGE